MSRSFKHKRYGGPTSIFVKHFSTENLIEDMTLLYTRLVDLGVECVADKYA
jgi:hypothetical protein